MILRLTPKTAALVGLTLLEAQRRARLAVHGHRGLLDGVSSTSSR